MEYKDLNDIFGKWYNTFIGSTNIYGYNTRQQGFQESILLKGDINKIIKELYFNKINKLKTYEMQEFSLEGYKPKQYGVMNIDIIKDELNFIFNPNYIELKDIEGNVDNEISKINFVVTEFILDKKSYYFLAYQQPTETFFKNKRILSVGKVLEEVPIDTSLVIMDNIDCIIDMEQECLYSLNNSNVIKMFNLEYLVKEDVKGKLELIKDWKFIDNFEFIENAIDQKNVYQNLFDIFKDKKYFDGLMGLNNNQLKSRLLRVSENKIKKEDFNSNKLIVSKHNLALFMKIIAKKTRYNIVTDGIED